MKHQVTDISGIGEATAALLAEHGLDSVKALKKGGVKQLMSVPGFGEIRANAVFVAIEELNEGEITTTKKESGNKKVKKAPKKEAKKKSKKDKKKTEKKKNDKKKSKKK
ncbi:MAG: hypothetical protein AUK35_03990 [Zetaproteobacteria bacterium CG2_30_46_52]|nr:MAG: hypothetical protein AUK35_03990 [Zetaproteobacteria bacterium CG2_30_46_52]